MKWILENWDLILLGFAIVDVIIGALPNSWVKYTGVILNVMNALRTFDIKEAADKVKKEKKPSAGGIFSIILLCFLFVGCFASFQVNPETGLVKYERFGGQEISGLMVEKTTDKILVSIQGVKSSNGVEEIKAATELLKAIPGG